MINLTDLVTKLKKERSVALLCHARPDGDCLGGACALKLAFEKLGIKAVVCAVEPVPERFKFLPEMSLVVNYLYADENYSGLIAIDCADLTRRSEGDYFSRFKNTYNIDHHVSNEGYARTNYVVDKAANCENVYEIIREMGVEIDREMADLLMLGLVTDTGIFRHKNTTDQTLLVASQLKKIGANLNLIGRSEEHTSELQSL